MRNGTTLVTFSATVALETGKAAYKIEYKSYPTKGKIISLASRKTHFKGINEGFTLHGLLLRICSECVSAHRSRKYVAMQLKNFLRK